MELNIIPEIIAMQVFYVSQSARRGAGWEVVFGGRRHRRERDFALNVVADAVKVATEVLLAKNVAKERYEVLGYDVLLDRRGRDSGFIVVFRAWHKAMPHTYVRTFVDKDGLCRPYFWRVCAACGRHALCAPSQDEADQLARKDGWMVGAQCSLCSSCVNGTQQK